MNEEFINALEELELERGISKDTLLEAIEAALAAAYTKHYRHGHEPEDTRVQVDGKTGEIRVFTEKMVTDRTNLTQEEQRNYITLDEARVEHPEAEVEDIIQVVITPKSFGRIAAQTAKQVVMQRIRDAGRDVVYDKYSEKENQVLMAVVHRVDKERGNVYVHLGSESDAAEGVIPAKEMIPNEHLSIDDRVYVFVLEVRRTSKGPQIIVSRTHRNIIRKLFENEVPEILDGTVEIKSIAREAGARTKIAVASLEKNVDPVGACVGPKGVRIERVVEDLNGEKIDVIPWSADPIEFIANALRPAKVLRVQINEDERAARVIVPDAQLSLAIGKEGQNARLAARLTGWKIDIKSKTQAEREVFGAAFAEAPVDIEGLQPPSAFDLIDDLHAEEAQEDIETDLLLDEEFGSAKGEDANAQGSASAETQEEEAFSLELEDEDLSEGSLAIEDEDDRVLDDEED